MIEAMGGNATPMAFAMGISAALTFWVEGLPPLMTFQRTISGISVFSLLAIPFFIFAGELMLHGGIARKLVHFAGTLVGHVRGGLGPVRTLGRVEPLTAETALGGRVLDHLRTIWAGLHSSLKVAQWAKNPPAHGMPANP